MTQNGWTPFLEHEFEQPYFKTLIKKVEQAYLETTVFPPKDHIFEAFALTCYHNVKVVILGQDPYHQQNQSHGLCFSVQDGVKIPPSLRSIYKELQSDLDIPMANHGNLTKWAQQGVFLLNAVLTVEKDKPNSHLQFGWNQFTDHALVHLNAREQPMVFILWGNLAKAKKPLLNNSHHLILEAAHPSPLSSWQNFYGTKPFSQANAFLVATNQTPIDWNLEDTHV